MLNNFTSLQDNGKQGVVRNGHLPERHLQTEFSELTLKVPKVRDIKLIIFPLPWITRFINMNARMKFLYSKSKCSRWASITSSIFNTGRSFVLLL
ncbi:hypothetical protein [Candidatus Enterovibrio escicola]|uniref:hypothetical protein n=1 Tax=Candidatus Enterovibrio escicola TaxID=1927127 RepID=UPI0011BACFC5|nr:hypothetical protein [Candidatus Enterovibrio escacola]